MDAFFAINTQYVVDIPQGNNGILEEGEKGMFAIKSKLKKLEIEKGSKIILLRPQPDEFKFTNEGLITDIGVTTIDKSHSEVSKRINLGGSTEDSYLHNFEFKINKKLEKNNLLSDLDYSLELIYIYHKPITHFEKQYRGLNKNDFDTIVNGSVYAIRTVFGKLINALPRQNKLEFSLQAMDKFSTVDFMEIPLETGLEFLLKYINGRILNRGRLLVKTFDLIKDNLNNILPVNEVGFINPEGDKSNLLGVQAQIFKNLFSLENSNDLLSLIKTSTQQNAQTEERFLKNFSKKTWPIDLRISA